MKKRVTARGRTNQSGTGDGPNGGSAVIRLAHERKDIMKKPKYFLALLIVLAGCRTLPLPPPPPVLPLPPPPPGLPHPR
jgi:hypothetical protein